MPCASALCSARKDIFMLIWNGFFWKVEIKPLSVFLSRTLLLTSDCCCLTSSLLRLQETGHMPKLVGLSFGFSHWFILGEMCSREHVFFAISLQGALGYSEVIDPPLSTPSRALAGRVPALCLGGGGRGHFLQSSYSSQVQHNQAMPNHELSL